MTDRRRMGATGVINRRRWVAWALWATVLAVVALACEPATNPDRQGVNKVSGYVVTADIVSVVGLKLVPHLPRLGVTDSVLMCAFPVFGSGEVGIGTLDHPACDAAYASLPLTGWQRHLYPEQQFITDTLCIDFKASGGTFTADAGNVCPSVSLPPPPPPPSGLLDTLFRADFASGAPGWYPVAGTWATSGGLYQNTANAAAASGGVNVGDAFSWAGSNLWTDYTVSAKVTPRSWSGAFGLVRVFARWKDASNWYYVNLTSDGHVQLRKYVAGVATDLAPPVAYPVVLGRTYKVSLAVVGTSLKAYVNDTLRLSASDATFASGPVGVGGWQSLGSFDDVLVTRPRAATVAPAVMMQRIAAPVAPAQPGKPLRARRVIRLTLAPPIDGQASPSRQVRNITVAVRAGAATR